MTADVGDGDAAASAVGDAAASAEGDGKAVASAVGDATALAEGDGDGLVVAASVRGAVAKDCWDASSENADNGIPFRKTSTQTRSENNLFFMI